MKFDEDYPYRPAKDYEPVDEDIDDGSYILQFVFWLIVIAVLSVLVIIVTAVNIEQCTTAGLNCYTFPTR